MSLHRLRDRLNVTNAANEWRLEGGNIVRVGRAQASFFSADPSANVVGATADLLLELDEAQDVDPEKFLKEFRPMGATGNATTVLYGTPWDGGTLLETTAAENRELERRDGIRRHFHFDWEAVAACSPHYRALRGGGAGAAGRGAPAVPHAVPAAAHRAGRGDVQPVAAGAAAGRALAAARAAAGAGVRGGRRRGGRAVGGRGRGGGPTSSSAQDGVRANGGRGAGDGTRRW